MGLRLTGDWADMGKKTKTKQTLINIWMVTKPKAEGA